jgi:chromosome segregation ATPase
MVAGNGSEEFGAEAEAKQQIFQTLKEENKELSESLSIASDEIKRLRDEEYLHNCVIAEMTKENQTLSRSSQDLKHNIAELVSINKGLQREFEIKVALFNEKNSAKDQIIQGTDAQLTASRSELSQLTLRISMAENKESLSRNEAIRLSNELSYFQTITAANNEQKAEIIQALSQQISRLSSEVDHFKFEQVSYKSEIKEYESQFESLLSMIGKEKNTDCFKIKDMANIINSHLTAIKNQSESELFAAKCNIALQHDKSLEAVEIYREEIAKLQSDLELARNDLISNNNVQSEQIDSLEIENEQMQDKIHQLKEEKNVLINSALVLSNEKESLISKIEMINEEFSSLKSKLSFSDGSSPISSLEIINHKVLVLESDVNQNYDSVIRSLKVIIVFFFVLFLLKYK